MKYSNIPLKRLEDEHFFLSNRLKKREVPEELTKKDLEDLETEINTRTESYGSSGKKWEKELGSLVSGIFQGMTLEHGDELLGSYFGDEYKTNLRDYDEFLRRDHPAIHFLGDLTGNALLGMGAGKVVGGAIKNIPELKKIIDTYSKGKKGAEGLKGLGYWVTDRGLDALYGGAISMLTGIGLGTTYEERIKNAKTFGADGALLSSLVGWLSPPLLKHIDNIIDNKQVLKRAQSMGIENTEEFQKFLLHVAKDPTERKAFLQAIEGRGVGNGTIADSTDKVSQWIDDILIQRDKEVKDLYAKFPNAKDKFPIVDKETIHELYKRKLPSYDDDISKMIDAYWTPLEPKEFSEASRNYNAQKISSPINAPPGQMDLPLPGMAAFSTKKRGKAASNIVNPPTPIVGTLNASPMFKLTPEHFSKIDSRINRNFPWIHITDYMPMEGEAQKMFSNARNMKRAGDDILKTLRKTFQSIDQNLNVDRDANKFFGEFYNQYNKNDRTLNKLSNLKRVLINISEDRLKPKTLTNEATRLLNTSNGKVASVAGLLSMPLAMKMGFSGPIATLMGMGIGTAAYKGSQAANSVIRKLPNDVLNLAKQPGNLPFISFLTKLKNRDTAHFSDEEKSLLEELKKAGYTPSSYYEENDKMMKNQLEKYYKE